jgi:hypothetical protein
MPGAAEKVANMTEMIPTLVVSMAKRTLEKN